MQPPSGGCVLKLIKSTFTIKSPSAAAFGRLCVETVLVNFVNAFGKAAAFGRLCVETKGKVANVDLVASSHLRAAVC